MTRQRSLFEGERLQMTESIDLTIQSLTAYGATHKHWAIAWSGGKDSTALLTLVVYLLRSGKVPHPQTLTVLYADTRMELLPLAFAAGAIRDELAEHAPALAAIGTHLEVHTVMAPIDKRYFVYVLGRGVPPPNNNTLRWCTRQIKIDPMAAALRELHGARGEKILMLTGLRLGESAARDSRIALACGSNGGECGQGWYQETLPDQLCDTLAPILWWRVCHVWAWLKHHAPTVEFGDWTTEPVAVAYGGDEAEEKHARTGCVGCPLAERDTALDLVVAQPAWAYLQPLKRLRPLYRQLREPARRLRKAGLELRQDGTPAANPQRMGPITLEARAWALELVLEVQREVNAAAATLGRPALDLLNAEEEARIRELIAARTWPDKWSGDEPHGDELLESVFADGTSQPLLWPRAPAREGR